MAGAAKILGKVKRGVEKVAYGNPLYHKILTAGAAPDRLTFTPPDPWPGEAEAGMALMAAQRSIFDGLERPRGDMLAVDQRATATVLRNLRSVGTDAARGLATSLIAQGMARCESWNDAEWEPAMLGARVAAWIGFYDFYAPMAADGFIAHLTENLARQWRHMLRALPGTLDGLAGMNIIRGLTYGAFNFAGNEEEMERSLGLACDLLRRHIVAEILPDGTHRARNPSVHLRFLQALIELRAVFTLAGLPWPHEAAMAITTMTPVLKFYRHGDGGLALFHGGREESALMIDATINFAEAKGRMPRRLTHGGFERLTAGRSWMVADGGAPALGGHAGLLAFEFGQGKERIIVNGGGYEDDPRASLAHNQAWRTAMAATAAHSTLTLHDTNAAEVTASGGVRGTVGCSAQRYEHDNVLGVEMRHDGYRAPFGMMVQRTLEMALDGETLSGREVLDGGAVTRSGGTASGRDFSLRWHLHPSVNVALGQNGQTALLKTASGAGWRLRVEGYDLALEPSIYCGMGAPRRSMQIKVSGVADAAPTIILWSLTREKK